MDEGRTRSTAAWLGKGQPEAEAVPRYTSKHKWDRFDQAVYDYAQQCALRELEQEGCIWPPGDVQWWAKEYMLSFFLYLDEDVFKDIGRDRNYVLQEAGQPLVVDLHQDVFRDFALERDYILEKAEHRFVVGFRSAWSVASQLAWNVASGLLKEEFG